MEFELDWNKECGKVKQRRLSLPHSYRVKIQIDCRVPGAFHSFLFYT